MSEGKKVLSFPEAVRINTANTMEVKMSSMFSKLYSNPAACSQYQIYPTKLYPTMPSKMIEEKERKIHGEYFQLDPSNASHTQYQVYPTKRYPMMPSNVIENKERNLQGKDLQLEPPRGNRSDNSKNTKKLPTASKDVNSGTPLGRINPANTKDVKMNSMISKLYSNPAACSQHQIYPTKLYPIIPSKMIEKKERKIHGKYFQLDPSNASHTQYQVYPTKLYPMMPSNVIENKERNIQGKDLHLEPPKGNRSDQSKNKKKLPTPSKDDNFGTPLGLASSIYAPTQLVTPISVENWWQLYNQQEKQNLHQKAEKRESCQTKLTADMLSSQGRNAHPSWVRQPRFPISCLRFPQHALNSPELKLRQTQTPKSEAPTIQKQELYDPAKATIPKTEAPTIPKQELYDPVKAAEIYQNMEFEPLLGYKPLPNTFWPVPPNCMQLSGFRFFENLW
jgi:hypothetical protein